MTISNRQLTTLAAVAAVLVVLTVVLYGTDRTPRPDVQKGALLIQGLELDKIAKIALKDKEHALTLARQDKDFVVVESNNYPAATKKINDLLIKCLEIRIAEKVTDSASGHADLGVADDSKDATVVKFFGDQAAGGDEDAEKKAEAKAAKGTAPEPQETAKLLIGFVVGKSATRGSGSYVRLLGEDTVYTTEQSLYLTTSPTSYMETDIVNVKKEDVQQVTVKLKDETYTIARDKDDKVALLSIPQGKKAKETEVDGVFDALSWLSFTEVLPVSKVTAAWDAAFTGQLKKDKHTTYVAQLARQGEKHYLRIAAQGPPADLLERSRMIRKDAPKEELEKKDAVFTAADKAEAFTARHQSWAYEVSSWKAEKMRKPLGELLEDLPKPDQAAAPDEIAASHILLAYKGAERADAAVTRTKEEAKKLADEILVKVNAPGADFAALAKQHSACSSKDKGGDLGSFKKGSMHKNFEDAAWKLKVGDLSDVVETPFGFHIIKRTK